MPEHKTSALILDMKDFGETDRIVTFYTSNFGKLKGIAKGAKKSQRRFGAAMDLFSCVSLSFFSKEIHGLVMVNQCQIQQVFPSLHKDIIPMGYGSYMAELINEMTAERVEHQDIFEMLVHFFSLLDRFPPREEYLRIFEMRLLFALGYCPSLTRCVACKKELEKGKDFRFSISRGGVVCAFCSNNGKDEYSVSQGTLKLLQQAYILSIDKISRLIFSTQALAESREFLPRFIQYHLGKELKTSKFLKKMEKDRF